LTRGGEDFRLRIGFYGGSAAHAATKHDGS
jgi:hypothetical protein